MGSLVAPDPGGPRPHSPRPRHAKSLTHPHRRYEEPLKDGPLAHLPSGKYAANASWIAHAVIAFNIARATAVAAAMRTARWATLRTRTINIPGRIATTGRRLVLHLPRRWPWASGWEQLWATATSPPATLTA